MPTKIVITGACGSVGRAVLGMLWDLNAETIAIVRTGCTVRASKILVSQLDSDRTQKAIQRADVIVHLAGTRHPKVSDTYYGANVATAVAVARASRDSNVKRIVMLSVLGADECSSNEYLRTKARAERILLSTKIPIVIFRTSHIVGDPQNPGAFARMLLSPDGEPVKILGSGKQVVAPIYIRDVCQAIIQAVESNRTGTYDLSGPDSMTIDDLVRLLNRDRKVSVSHLPDRLAMHLTRIMPGMPPALVEVMARSCVTDSSRAVREFGLKLHSLRAVWAPITDGSQAAETSIRDRFLLVP